ncbi:MAG TPA: glycosyltransferase [Patescibacteria group bacterium]
MKILVIAPTPFFSDRGTHIRILEEALALEKLGHQITIATYHIGKEISNEIRTGIDVRRIRRLLFWYKKLEAGPDWQKIILDIMLIRKTFNLARTQRPDIIHAHIHEGVMIGWIVQKLLFWRKIKLVADFHGSLTKEMVSHSYLSGGTLKAIFNFLEKFIDNLGDYAIASSAENTEEISRLRKDDKIMTVLDGVNLENYANLPSKTNAKKELELPEDKIIVAYTGALVPNKGIQYLWDAVTMSAGFSQDLFFVIAGFPIEEAKKFVKDKNLADRVRLISPLSYFDLPKLLNACDIGIDPKDSAVSQASGKILQYMGAGLPVVCFDRKNNREYVDAGAYYSREISANGLAEGMQYFLDKPEEAIALGRFNQERAENFSWDKSALVIENIYKKIT